MPKPVKLILVTAKDHPQHKMWVKMAEELSKEFGVELEVRYEDYLLLTEHGETDELGMAWLPQLLVELDNGEIKPLLSRMPLNEALQPDPEKAKEAVREKLRQLTGGG